MSRTGLNSPLWIPNWPQSVWMHLIFWTIAAAFAAGPLAWLWTITFEP